MNYQRLHVHTQIANELIGMLENGVKVSDTLYNARCPCCGDSKTDASKRRFFIYVKQNGASADDSTILRCYCHKCGSSNHLTAGAWITTFVRDQYPSLYSKYKEDLSEFADTRKYVQNINKQIKDIGKPQIKNSVGFDDIARPEVRTRVEYPSQIFDMVRLDLLKDSNTKHPLVQYALNRSLPEDQFNRLYVTNDFKKSMSHIPQFVANVEKLYNGTMALVMPMFNSNNEITGMQGRFLSDKFRFLTLMLPEQEKFFGIETIDYSRTHYVLEAPLDSLHVENAIATLDSNLGKSQLLANSYVYVFDNQPRSREICKAMLTIIKAGFKVVIFDKGNHYKDINEMVDNGYLSNSYVNTYLENNTYQHDYAIDKFNDWKKVSL